MIKILFPRGGLGNRLRFLETTLHHDEFRYLIIWAINNECHISFSDIFIARSTTVFKIIEVGGILGFFFNSANLILSKLLKNRISRDLRHFNHNAFFISSVHSLSPTLNRFNIIHFSQDVIQEYSLNTDTDYVVFYLRGTDNLKAIESTDYKRLFDSLHHRIPFVKCLGISDDIALKNVLKSFGAQLIRPGKSNRSSKIGMLEAVQDLVIMSLAKEIHCSNYSSFAELGYSMSNCASLITYKLYTDNSDIAN